MGSVDNTRPLSVIHAAIPYERTQDLDQFKSFITELCDLLPVHMVMRVIGCHCQISFILL